MFRLNFFFKVFSRKTFCPQQRDFPALLLPTSLRSAPPGFPAGTVLAGGQAWPVMGIQILCSPPDFLRSTNLPAVCTEPPAGGCSPDWCPSSQSQACQEWSGSWSQACTAAALLIQGTRSLSRSFASLEESGTTEGGRVRSGCLADPRDP